MPQIIQELPHEEDSNLISDANPSSPRGHDEDEDMLMAKEEAIKLSASKGVPSPEKDEEMEIVQEV